MLEAVPGRLWDTRGVGCFAGPHHLKAKEHREGVRTMSTLRDTDPVEQPSPDLPDRIVDTAVELAEKVGWENLRLRKVADRLGVPLVIVLDNFRDADAVADAWFARALRAMVPPPEPGFEAFSARARVHAVLMRWFDAQAAHRRVAGEMLRTKLYPSHPHHWVPMIFSLSRLIHWVREAALVDAGGRPRQREEVGLTLAFLRTLRVWLSDGSPGQDYTRRFLDRRLRWLDRLHRCRPERRAKPAEPPAGTEAAPVGRTPLIG
jgi:AcrR family transcriptional regulator